MDDSLGLEVWSLPHVGTFAKRLVLSKFIESYTFNDRFNDLCDGVFTIPDDAALPSGALVKDKLLKIDEANHANDVGSVVRLLRGGVPIHHQIVTRSEDTWADTDPTTKFNTEGLEWLLDRVTVPHYDHPADPTVEPDWIYGADTLLNNPGLENSPQSIEVQHFYHAQGSGTYTISYAGQTTTALNWDATWFDVHEALEALPNIQDVIVSGNGNAGIPFEIEFLDPSGDVSPLGSSATGALIVEMTKGGVRDPAGWTKSFHPQTGVEHGNYTTFEVSADTAHTGTYSLKVVATPNTFATDYPGVQQIVNVTAGRTYRMSVWVRSTAAKSFRLIARTMDETVIAFTEATLVANTWTEIVIPPFEVPEHINQIIFRVGLIDTTGGTFYVDDGVLAPGFPEAPLGQILSDIRTAALAAGSPLGWLTPTWSTTLDSAGNAWDRDLKWNVNHDQTFLQLIEYFRRWNYEHRIRWDVGDNRFEWDIFNPSEGGQTRANIAITGKSGVSSSGPVVKRPPDYTYMRVEGELGKWGEFASTTLDDVWGRLEKAQSDRQGVFSEELDEFAERLVTRGQDRTASRSVQVEDPAILPWTAYEPGDVVTLNLAPKDDRKALRIAACVVSMAKGAATPRYEVHFVSPVLTNDAAMAQGLRTLLREFRRPVTLAPAAKPEPSPIRPSGGNFIYIAASNSRPDLQLTADYLCDGVDDHVEWQAAVDFIKATGGIIVACAGDYVFGDTVYPTFINGSITLWGDGRAIIHHTTTISAAGTGGAQGRWIFDMTNTVDAGLPIIPTVKFDGLAFVGDGVAQAAGIILHGTSQHPHLVITNCHFNDFDNRFIFGDHGNLTRFEISHNQFEDSNITGGQNEAPQMACIQINSGSANFASRCFDNTFRNIQFPAYFSHLVEFNPTGTQPNSIYDNMVSGCDTPAFNADAVYNNWLEGVFTP